MKKPATPAQLAALEKAFIARNNKRIAAGLPPLKRKNAPPTARDPDDNRSGPNTEEEMEEAIAAGKRELEEMKAREAELRRQAAEEERLRREDEEEELRQPPRRPKRGPVLNPLGGPRNPTEGDEFSGPVKIPARGQPPRKGKKIKIVKPAGTRGTVRQFGPEGGLAFNFD